MGVLSVYLESGGRVLSVYLEPGPTGCTQLYRRCVFLKNNRLAKLRPKLRPKLRLNGSVQSEEASYLPTPAIGPPGDGRWQGQTACELEMTALRNRWTRRWNNPLRSFQKGTGTCEIT